MTILGKYFETESLGHDQYQTTFGLKPINYQDVGIWKRIVNNWGDSGIGERPYIVTAAPFIASVSPDGLRRIHPTRENDVWFEMSGAKINNAGTWEVIQLGTPTSRIDNRITWNRTNYNAYMDMAGHYIKLGYLLKNGYQPPNNQFAYEVATNGFTRQGGTLLKDGVPVMHMRKPIAYDYDNPDDIRQIAHEFSQIDGKWHVVFTLPDLTGMAKPVIDPTLELQPDAAAGIDTTLGGINNTKCYGDAVKLYIGEANNAPINYYRSLIKFDLSSLPSDATITSCTLALVITNDYSDNARTFRLYRQKRAWVEGVEEDPSTDGATWDEYDAGSSLAWQTAGGFGANDCEQTDIGTVSMGAADTGTKTFTLTPTTKAALDLGNGWLIKADTELDDAYLFDSSDSAPAANRPKLVVNYTEGGGDGNPRILQKMRLGY